MSKRVDVADIPEDVKALESQLAALETERADIATELQAAETERARLDGALVEDDGAEAAYVGAVSVVRALRRRAAVVNTEITAARERLHAAHVAILVAEEKADAEDREQVERALARAAQMLADYQGRAEARRIRRSELGLKVPSRLDALPARRAHQLAARYLWRFGLTSPLTDKRME